MSPLEDIGHLRAVRAAPGDLFVIKVQNKITREHGAGIRAAILEATADWGFEPRVLILDGGVELGVLSPNASAESAVGALVAACETAFAGDNMADEPDDEDISLPPTGITFGMIRRARAELLGQG